MDKGNKKRPWIRSIAGTWLVTGMLVGCVGAQATPEAAPTVTVTATETLEAEPAPTVTVTMTVTESPPSGEYAFEEPSATETYGQSTTTDGLDMVTALRWCAFVAEKDIKNEYRASKVKVHWIAGVISEELSEDRDAWNLEIKATVDDTPFFVDCTVSGTEDAPVIDELRWY